MASVDYEGTRKEAFVPHPDTARYNLVATFPSPEAAGRAVAELHRTGFSDADVYILGTAADAVVNGTGMTRADQRIVKSTTLWTVAGTVAGAILGAIIGIIIMAIPAFQSAIGVHVTGVSYGLAAIFGAIIGSTLGLAGGVLGLDRRMAGVPTYSEQQAAGPTMVGVHTEDDDHTRTATTALHRTGATSVERFGGGNTIVA